MGQQRSKRTFSISPKAVVLFLILCSSISVLLLLSKNDNHSTGKVGSQPIIDAKGATEIEVLDATTSTKKVFDIIHILRSNGFDVVEYRRLHNEPIDKSCIIVYNTTKVEDAKKIATLLSIDPKRITTKVDPKAFVDISVLLAKDIRRSIQ